MRNRMIFLIISIILIISLTGCFGAEELDDLGISLLMGIDIEDDKVLITAEVVDPSYVLQGTSPGEGSAVTYVQGVGNNLFEAFRDISLKFGRRIYASHNKVLIFGEEVAKRGLVTHLDELFRDRQQRESAYMLIAKGAKAYEVMGINAGLETITANYIVELIESFRFNPKAIDTNMVQYLKDYYHEGHHPPTGIIQKINRREIEQTGENAGTQGYELSTLGSAVFKEDILVGYLNGNDTKSLNFVMDNIEGGIITFPTPPPSGEAELDPEAVHKNLSTVAMVKSSTQNDVEIKGDRILLKTRIKIRGTLEEVVGDIDVSKRENLERMAEVCSKTVEENITKAIKKIQKEYGLDIFGFGMAFHRKYPEQWENMKENWDEYFVDADVQVEVETHIIRTGLINKPLVQ